MGCIGLNRKGKNEGLADSRVVEAYVDKFEDDNVPIDNTTIYMFKFAKFRDEVDYCKYK